MGIDVAKHNADIRFAALVFKRRLGVTVIPISAYSKVPPKGISLNSLYRQVFEEGRDQTEEEAEELFNWFERTYPNQPMNWAYFSGATRKVRVEDCDGFSPEFPGYTVRTPNGGYHVVHIYEGKQEEAPTIVRKNPETGQGYEVRGYYSYDLGIGSIVITDNGELGKYEPVRGTPRPSTITAEELRKRCEHYTEKYSLYKHSESRRKAEVNDKSLQDKANRLGRVVIKSFRGVRLILERYGCKFVNDRVFCSNINRENNPDEKPSGNLYPDFRTGEPRIHDFGNGGFNGDVYDFFRTIGLNFAQAEKEILKIVPREELIFPEKKQPKPNCEVKLRKNATGLMRALEVLQKKANDELEVTISIKQLADELGISKQRASKLLKVLTGQQFLKVLTPATPTQPTTYKVPPQSVDPSAETVDSSNHIYSFSGNPNREGSILFREPNIINSYLSTKVNRKKTSVDPRREEIEYCTIYFLVNKPAIVGVDGRVYPEHDDKFRAEHSYRLPVPNAEIFVKHGEGRITRYHGVEKCEPTSSVELPLEIARREVSELYAF